MGTAYLLTGGNLGQRERNLAQALDQIHISGALIERVSSLYETAAWGMEDQPRFLNQAIIICTALNPDALLGTLLGIEEKIGRVRKEKYGPRLIDIDILLFDDLLIDTSNLILPHPRLAERRFALTPLAEIAGNVIHPVLGKTINELLAECTDPLPVKRIDS